MEEGCWVSGVSKNGIIRAQGGPTLFGSHCTSIKGESKQNSIRNLNPYVFIE